MLLLRLCQGCRLALAKRPLPAKGLLAPLLGGLVSSGRPWASVARAKAPPKALRRPKDLAGPSTARLGWAELWRLLRPYSLWLLAAIAAALLAALLNVRIPLELGKLVGAVAAKDRGLLLASAAKLVSLYALQGLLSAAYIGLVGVLGERVARDLRRDLFAAVIHQDMAFFDERRTGEIVARLSSDVQEFKSALKLSISQGLRATTQTAGSLASLWLLSPEMAGWTVAVVPAVVVGGALLGSGLRSLSRASQEQTAKAVGVADEAVSSVRTVRAFAAEAWEEARFARETDAARRLAELLGFGIGLFQGATNLFLNGTVLAVLYKGAGLIEAGELAPGDLYPFNLLRRHVGPAQETVQRSLGQLSVIAGQAIKGASAGGRVLEYIKAPRSMPLQGGHVIPKAELRGELELRDVTFAYPSRPHAKVLEGMSLRVPAKSTVALCGPSGQGKSTVAALLERFYDVDSGSVLVDGADVRSLDAGWLRGKALGFIAQEPVLFAGSVADNIRYGRPDASQADVEAAAHLANAHDFVKEFPDGYQTEVGERGGRLSGGQKQRIAIARALIKDPAVLILDEATSALDPASEAKVQEALRRAASGRTVVIIAHRLSTIQHADTIAVLSGGKVAEMGSHAELLRRFEDFSSRKQHTDNTDINSTKFTKYPHQEGAEPRQGKNLSQQPRVETRPASRNVGQGLREGVPPDRRPARLRPSKRLLPPGVALFARVAFQRRCADETWPLASLDSAVVLDHHDLAGRLFYHAPSPGFVKLERTVGPGTELCYRVLVWLNSAQLHPAVWARTVATTELGKLPAANALLTTLTESMEAGLSGDLEVDCAEGRLRSSSDLLKAASPFFRQMAAFYELADGGEPAARRARRSVDLSAYPSLVVRTVLRHALTGQLSRDRVAVFGLTDLAGLLALAEIVDAPNRRIFQVLVEEAVLGRELGRTEAAEALRLADLHGLRIARAALLYRIAKNPFPYLKDGSLGAGLWAEAEALAAGLAGVEGPFPAAFVAPIEPASPALSHMHL